MWCVLMFPWHETPGIKIMLIHYAPWLRLATSLHTNKENLDNVNVNGGYSTLTD